MLQVYSLIFSIIIGILAQPPLCTDLNSAATCLPCPSNCLQCSSSTQCTTCESQYYASTTDGTLQCLACPAYCLECSSTTICTLCQDPYVLVGDACQECTINFASKCLTTVKATACIFEYYVSEDYCYNCLLNCKQCSSSSDCSLCSEGYTLNTTVLTCIPCQTGCKTCTFGSTIICNECLSGYILHGNACNPQTCNIDNCKYCSTDGNSCSQCNFPYYWKSTTAQCTYGASVTCSNGAIGPYPTDCIHTCEAFSSMKTIFSPRFLCLPYSNIDINTIKYKQLYYYSYNDYQELISLGGSENPLTYQSSINEYSYTFGQLSWGSLPAYFRINFYIKFMSESTGNLEISATTPQSTQHESIIISNANALQVQEYSTVQLHSDNLKMVSTTGVQLVELLMRFSLCPEGCLRCLNVELCELCIEPQYQLGYKCVDSCTVYYHLTINRTCVVSCPDGYYHRNVQENNKICELCQSPCVTCSSITNCLSCIDGKYFINYECITTCPDGYYGSNSGTCQPCISPCKTCTDQTTCLSCDQGYWNGQICTNSCPSGSYGNNATRSCEDCDSSCQTCLNISTHCTSCASDKYMFNFQCFSSCPERYYPSSSTCLACKLPCYTCTSESSCLTCSFNFLSASSCITTCPITSYPDLILRKCTPCSLPCQSCTSPNQCTTCLTGCLYQGSCPTTCPSDDWYADTTTTSGKCFCQQCTYPCKQCISSSQCTSCLTGFLFQRECTTICPAQYYGNPQTSVCTLCSETFPSCSQCVSSQCLLCSGQFLLHNGQCIQSCPQYYYQSLQKCQKCIAPCESCTSFTACTSCVSPYILFTESCIIQCPFGQVNINNVCQTCQSPCLTCSNQVTSCTMCQSGHFLNGNQCITDCSTIEPTFTFYNEPITSVCSSCFFPCKECTSQSFCKSCKIGYLIQNIGKCEDCLPGTYANQNVCTDCPNQCSTCLSESICTACSDGFYLYLQGCISNISICQSNGYYASGRVCQPCTPPCSHCTSTSTKCTTCLTGYIFFQPNSCLIECPVGYFRSSSSCNECASVCTQCITAADYCLACKSPNLLHLATMKCVASCPDQTYAEGSLCQSCRYPCQNCLSESQCSSCISGTLIGNACHSACLSGDFTNAQSICQTCTEPCSECITTASTCTQCIATTFLHSNECLSECPDGFFASSESRQCLQCLPICKTCLDHINCASCNDNKLYFLNPTTNYGQCLLSCPSGFYQTVGNGLSRNICTACRSDCSECQNGAGCILCNDAKYQHNGQCLVSCPSQMYPSGGICQVCTQPCQDCTDTSTCTSCISSDSLLVGNAQCISGTICPVNYYKLEGVNECSTNCPSGSYHRNDRTCNSAGCSSNEYKGADYQCFKQCPHGYLANRDYECIWCGNSGCSGGLFFSISYEILRDDLLVYIDFTQEPVYQVSEPSLSITPVINSEIIDFKSSAFAKSGQLSQISTIRFSGATRIKIRFLPSTSLEETLYTVNFMQPLSSFQNPIQQQSNSFLLGGYDLYECTSSSWTFVGLLALACALVGLVKNPYMTDFGQLIFLLALLNVHYPCSFEEFLSSCEIAHLNDIISIPQSYDIGFGKFSYIVSLGLLSNAFTSILIVIVGLAIACILYIVMVIIRRVLKYNKVHADSEPDDHLQNNLAGQSQPTKCIGIESGLTALFQRFHILYLNRLVYFTYTMLALFSISQLQAFNLSQGVDAAASILAILFIILLLIYPITLAKVKPKYTFLYARKLLLALITVISARHPLFIVGIMSVCNLTAAILAATYTLERWKVEVRVLVIGQIMQLILQILLAVYIIIGEGYQTPTKLFLTYLMIGLITLILVGYLIFSIFDLVLFVIWKVTGIDYKEIWSQAQDNSQSEKDSESISDGSMKDNEAKKNRIPNSQKTQIQKQFERKRTLSGMKEMEGQGEDDQPQQGQENFWAYNDDDGSVDNKSIPKILIRCVNELSDHDPHENKQQKDQ